MTWRTPRSALDATRGHAITSAQDVQLSSGGVAGQQRHRLHEVHVGARLATAALVRGVDEPAQATELHQHLGNLPLASRSHEFRRLERVKALEQTACLVEVVAARAARTPYADH